MTPKQDELINKLIAERDTLRTFAQYCLEDWPDDEHDGCDVQDKAVELGLLKLTEPAPTEPCCDECRCAECYLESDFRDGQVMCYRRTALLTGEKV